MRKNIFDKTYLIPGSIVGVTMLVGGILTLPATRAEGSDTSVSTATITVPVACSMIGVVDIPHTAEIPNGIDSRGSDYYPDGIGQTTLKAYCNDSEGFSIYAVGYSDDTIGNTYLRDATLGQDEDIQTSTTFSGTDSAWAMKIGVTSGNYPAIVAGSSSDTEKESGDLDYSTWQAIPSSYTRVAYRNSATDIDNDSIASAEGPSVTTTYAAYISTTQKAGTYVGQVKYTLVHPASEEAPLSPQPATAGCINYFANASDALGTMGCQSQDDSGNALLDGASVTLLASNFSRTGYGFAGWSDSYDYATNSSAHFYGPQETITVPTGTTANGLSLYAVWVKSAGNIQSWNGCSSLTAADEATNIFSQSITALTDQRDSQTYAIAKLADGKCWMIENLRLEAEDTRSDANKALAQGYGTSTTYGNFSGLADAESANFTANYSSSATAATTANSLYYAGTQSGTATIDISQTSYAGYRMPRYNNTNTSARASSPTGNDTAMYSYGNYYTWAAAMANTIYYSGPTATDADGKTSETVGTSLCPSGWKLPYGRSTGNGSIAGGFSYLDAQLGGTGASSYSSTTPTGADMSKAWRAFPNNFLYSGYFGTSSAYGRGSYVYYWSSTAGNIRNSYYLFLDSLTVYPGTNNDGKYSGSSIRCVSGS